MYSNYSEILAAAKQHGPVTISVAVAQDKEILQAIKSAYDIGLAEAVLVGDVNIITPLLEEVGLPKEIKIEDAKDFSEASVKAASVVRNGEAQVVMKGLVNSSVFLRGVLDKENGLRSGKILSHLAAFEIPGQKKLVFHTDGGMNIAPTLEEKKAILNNALEALVAMGINKPKVALLAANEQVNEKMPVTVDCQALEQMINESPSCACLVEGPIAMDVAASAEAAKHKGIASKITGDVDLFFVPNIECGNLVGKTLVYYAGAKMSGIVLGATHPVVLCSRSDNAEAKLNSIALACLIASKNE